MATVSLCMITKNEEKILEQSLNSIKDVADEIIITDTGSNDRTVEIAKKFTDKVHFFKWIDDFSAARNFCSKFAHCDYILRWDADFILRKGDISKILALKKDDFANADIVRFKWNIGFGDNGVPTKSVPSLFFYKRDKFHWVSPIHNQLAANNQKEKITRAYFPDIEVNHHKDPFEKKHRYSQTARIIEKVLGKEPENTRLLRLHAEGLLFDNNFQKAAHTLKKYLRKAKKADEEEIISAIDLLIFCYISLREFDKAIKLAKRYYRKYINHPRFTLAYADALAATNLLESKKYYIRYLKNPITEKEDKYVYDFERFYIHPRLMLGQIYLLENDIQAARIFLNKVIKNTNFLATKNLATLILPQDED